MFFFFLCANANANASRFINVRGTGMPECAIFCSLILHDSIILILNSSVQEYFLCILMTLKV